MEIIIPTSGILSKSEVQKFKIMLIQSKLQENVNRLMTMLHIKYYSQFNLADIRIPDSVLSKRAMEEVQDICHPILLYHSYRTYFWSAGFALSEKLKVDSELLFVSSLLHDIGLTEKHHHICSKKCFANHGGDFSKEFSLKNGLKEQQANIIKQAIDMHLNPIVDKKKYGNEAYTLSKGAAMDVIGANRFQFSKKFVSEVHRFYSREGFKEDIISTMENFHHKEGTRADIMYKMGFAKMANKNPLDIK